MSFWGLYLDELRKRLVNMSIAIGNGFILCFNFSEAILGVLMLPLNAAVGYSWTFPFVHFTQNKTVHTLHFTALTEPFLAHLKIGLIAGIILMVPILLRQVWLFIAPGLLERERRYAGQFVFFATLFLVTRLLQSSCGAWRIIPSF